MKQILVKIRDKKTKAIMEVKASLAGDFVGTGQFEIVKENEEKPKEKEFNFKK